MNRILFISHLYPKSYDPLYGMVVHRQAYELKKLGCEVRVISPVIKIPALISKYKTSWRNYHSVPRSEVIEGIQVNYPKVNPIVAKYFSYKLGIYIFKKYEKEIEEIYKEFKFTHVHAQTALTNGLLGYEIAKKYKVPLITTVNGTDIDLEIYKSNKHFNTMKNVLINSDEVTAPSPMIQKKLIDRLNVEAEIIPRGIYLNQVYKSDSKLKYKYSGKFVILSVSRLMKSKGLDLNLYAISKLKNEIKSSIKYLLIGEGAEKERLENLVKELNIEENVEFLGFQEKSKVMEYMSICNLFSLPSWQETFGLVYLEAMAHGKVVIGSQGQGVDGIIKHKENGLLVKEKNVNDLTELMEFVINEKDFSQKIALNAQRDVIDYYSWEKIAMSTNKIYNTIV